MFRGRHAGPVLRAGVRPRAQGEDRRPHRRPRLRLGRDLRAGPSRKQRARLVNILVGSAVQAQAMLQSKYIHALVLFG